MSDENKNQNQNENEVLTQLDSEELDLVSGGKGSFCFLYIHWGKDEEVVATGVAG